MLQAEFIIRQMRAEDLPEVVRIQALCYHEIVPESAGSLADKQRLAPDSCLVASHGNTLLGYLLALPWQADSPPALDARISALPPRPDCLYLHDLAMDPAARGLGIGRLLVDHLLRQQQALWSQFCLIAIQDSAAWWQALGFAAVEADLALAAKLAGYGTKARYMRLLSDR